MNIFRYICQNINLFKRNSKNRVKDFIWTLCLLAPFISLQSCKDDFVIEGGTQNGEVEEINDDCIGFIMQLDRDVSSRSSDNFSMSSSLDSYDNYIDTQDKFRVFFFTESGDFLFGATDRTVSSLLQSSGADHNVDYWYIRIPMSMIVDRENQEYDIDKIKSYLKQNSFKVAVLANWPNAGAKINPADWDDRESTQNAEDNPSSTLKGHPLWNWNHSILNTKANPDSIRNINDLHHVYNDLYYGASSRYSNYEPYMAHVTGGRDPGWYMGEPTDWVKMRNVEDGWHSPNGKSLIDVNGRGDYGFTSREEANRWIRANCTPEESINKDKKIYRHYQHLWFLWNFDATYKYGSWLADHQNADAKTKKEEANRLYGNNWGWTDGSSQTPVNPWGTEWYGRNGQNIINGTAEEKGLYQWMKASLDNNKAIGAITINVGEKDNDVFFKYVARSGSYAYARKVGDNYGIQLPNIGSSRVTTETDGMITFQARTSGTLRVKWGSFNGSSSGLAIQVGNNTQPRIHSGVTSTEPLDWHNGTDNVSYWDISVEGSSQPVYIFCSQGNAVVYSIEFIRGRYLYETDREGVAPNPEQGIPMYGVQNFEKIEDWQRGTTITLPKNVYLVRALAKVEVYIKKTFGEPKHVYMRNMNRAARCEPMDVHTPTESLWKDQHINSQDCEWYNIIKHGPAYQSEYNSWFSWLYGSWKGPDCNWKVQAAKPYIIDYNKGYYVPNGKQEGWQKGDFRYSADSPHIFNPYLYRCDFCRFLQADEDSYSDPDYYKFVLYLPEKNIDDPGTTGDPNSTPRVPHIEYRFEPKVGNDDGASAAATDYNNSEYNLDDNDCFRIYFTNYGFSGDSSLGEENTYLKNGIYGRSTYDDYEKDSQHLKLHWPILRNHKYKFYVGGAGPENPEIWVQVENWGHRKVVVDW